MKAVKILTALCLVIFLNSFSSISISGQEKVAGSDKKFEVSDRNKKDKSDSPQNDKSNFPANESSVSHENQAFLKNKTNEKYRIGFQDTIEIQVFRHQDLSQVVNVSSDGTILMPRIDDPIVAVCKTERELGAYIGTLYKNYLKNPTVTVRIIDQRSQPFAVIGAVEKPGNFFLNRKTRLIELLALAGGQDVEKAGANIRITRIGNVGGCSEEGAIADESKGVEFITFKLNDVLEGKQNPWMQPGDIVSVLEAEEAYVIGQVVEPTKILLKQPITLTQAIAKANGLDKNAKTDKVTIQRQEANGGAKTELVYSLKSIREKKIPDPFLQANDIVMVSTDKTKALANGLLSAIGGGIPLIFNRLPLP